MTIAYLILCHTDPQYIKRLAKKITENTNDVAFVHVDGKSNFAPFQKELGNLPHVKLLENRVPVHWGGYSSVEATIRLFKSALSRERERFDRFVILQGLEYPIKTNHEIHEFFENKPKTEFILAQNISKTSNPKEKHKYSLYWHLDSASYLSVKILHKMYSALFLKTGIIPPFKPNYVKNAAGVKMDIHQGCAQFAVTRQLAEYIVKFHDENDGFNRYFRTMYAPDESYFHTIVYNSPFVKFTQNGQATTKPRLEDFENVTYFEYTKTITIFKSKDDWPKLRDSGFLFFRKASSESKALLDYIDEQHALQEANKQTN